MMSGVSFFAASRGSQVCGVAGIGGLLQFGEVVLCRHTAVPLRLKMPGNQMQQLPYWSYHRSTHQMPPSPCLAGWESTSVSYSAVVPSTA
jgi:hypothetical protein